MLAKYADIDYCEWFEGCAINWPLDNAHRLKKTKITTQLEYVDGRAKLCRTHHDFVEMGTRDEPSSHERMWELVNRCMEAQGRFIPRQDAEF